jgi:hypothetical protein
VIFKLVVITDHRRLPFEAKLRRRTSLEGSPKGRLPSRRQKSEAGAESVSEASLRKAADGAPAIKLSCVKINRDAVNQHLVTDVGHGATSGRHDSNDRRHGRNRELERAALRHS